VPVVDGRRGRAFDLRDRSLDAEHVAAAVASGAEAIVDSESTVAIDAESSAAIDPVSATTITAGASGSTSSGAPPIEIRCATPGPIHERVGVVEPDRTYPLRAALATVARRRGHRASKAAELAAVRDRLAALDIPPVGLAAERRAVAETDDAAALEEQVAALRGQLDLARERGDDPESLADAREQAVADLAERRTERLAAEQSLDRARSSAREARDRREERLRLEDREGNLQRQVRRELAAAIQPAFERALASLPGAATAGATPGSVDGPDAVGALAVCRIAPIRAPVVLAGDWFPSATAATGALGAPVVLVDP